MTEIKNRDADALEALRLRLEAVDGLWPVQWYNRKSNTATTAGEGYIVETPVGGTTVRAQIGTNGADPPLRERTRQWQLLLHVPVDSGLADVDQFTRIETALQATPITIDDGADGTIALLIDDISLRPPRAPTRGVGYVTRPIVVLYRFTAS